MSVVTAFSSAMLLLASGAEAQRAARLPGRLDVEWSRLTPGNTGIPGDYLHTLFLDENDRPWIPGYIPFWEHGGMAHFDGTSWFTVSNVDHPVISSPRFNDIVADANGVMWIATDSGLLSYDPAVGPPSLVRYDKGNTPMPADMIVAVDIAPDGALWLGADDVTGPPSGGLYRFDPAQGAWQIWTTANGLPWGAQWPGWDWIDFLACAPDPGGGFTVWFGSSEMGMATYKNGVFRSFAIDPPPPGTPKPLMLLGDRPADELGNVWMWTDRGLARRNPDETYLLTPTPVQSLSIVNAVSGGRALAGSYNGDVARWEGEWIQLGNWGGSFTDGLDEESGGAVWAGGIGGAARYQDGEWQRYRLTNTGMLGYFIRTVDFDSNGTLYVNGNAAPGTGGFDIFDGKDWTCVNNANYGLGPPWGLPGDETEALCVRANGKVAVALSGSGLYDWDGQTFTPLVPENLSFKELAEDGLGRLWAAQDYGGAYLVDTNGSWTYFSVAGGQLVTGEIGSIVPDPEASGWVWIAGLSGLAHTDGETWVNYTLEQIGLVENSVFYLLAYADRAADGTLWLGSLGLGLVHFDPDTGSFERFGTTNSALPSDWVYLVESAPDGSVWASTFDSFYPYPGGITHYDGRRWTTWTQFNSPLPLDQHWELESRRVPDGYEVWIGTAGEGLSIIHVEDPVKPLVAGKRSVR